MEYIVVSAEELLELSQRVNHLISGGWQPLGGVSVSGVGYERVDGLTGIYKEYCQAMVRGGDGH